MSNQLPSAFIFCWQPLSSAWLMSHSVFWSRWVALPRLALASLTLKLLECIMYNVHKGWQTCQPRSDQGIPASFKSKQGHETHAFCSKIITTTEVMYNSIPVSEVSVLLDGEDNTQCADHTMQFTRGKTKLYKGCYLEFLPCSRRLAQQWCTVAVATENIQEEQQSCQQGVWLRVSASFKRWQGHDKYMGCSESLNPSA